jgi:hypothetical protein
MFVDFLGEPQNPLGHRPKRGGRRGAVAAVVGRGRRSDGAAGGYPARAGTRAGRDRRGPGLSRAVRQACARDLVAESFHLERARHFQMSVADLGEGCGPAGQRLGSGATRGRHPTGRRGRESRVASAAGTRPGARPKRSSLFEPIYSGPWNQIIGGSSALTSVDTPVPYEDETQGGGCVPVREGGLARMEILDDRPPGGRGELAGQVWVGQPEYATIAPRSTPTGRPATSRGRAPRPHGWHWRDCGAAPRSSDSISHRGRGDARSGIVNIPSLREKSCHGYRCVPVLGTETSSTRSPRQGARGPFSRYAED